MGTYISVLGGLRPRQYVEDSLALVPGPATARAPCPLADLVPHLLTQGLVCGVAIT